LQLTAFGARDRAYFDGILWSAPRRQLKRNTLDRAQSPTTRPPVRANVCYNSAIALREENLPMHAVTLKEAKRDLERLLRQVLDDAEPTIVVLETGQQVVVVPLDEYTAWQETRYLLANPANAAHLRQSIAEAQAGAIEQRELRDV